jgi:hypothetical protein
MGRERGLEEKVMKKMRECNYLRILSKFPKQNVGWSRRRVLVAIKTGKDP